MQALIDYLAPCFAETRPTKRRVVYLRETPISIGTGGTEWGLAVCRRADDGAVRFERTE